MRGGSEFYVTSLRRPTQPIDAWVGHTATSRLSTGINKCAAAACTSTLLMR